ncbi:hypothetical protein SRABI27_02995 [Pedobacter sp. Bi27]|nr:hypothetical protein SRABI36_00459 [Pedobacter sp. Bi36]CAH0193233.1 hypothetical protein SRABI126_01553 [Pedobacter sp. Bi126]CAH0252340.1 hypothetical protein SRABI27_02995 [Pedobacter sp. Bi27]
MHHTEIDSDHIFDGPKGNNYAGKNNFECLYLNNQTYSYEC